MKTEKFKVKIPSYAMDYIFNSEIGELTESEILKIHDFLGRFPSFPHISVLSEESHFCYDPDFGIACDVFDCEVICIYDKKSKLNPFKPLTKVGV